MTETIYSTRAYERSMEATVLQTNEEEKAVLLDRTVFYPGEVVSHPIPASSGWATTPSPSPPPPRTPAGCGIGWRAASLRAGTAIRGEIDWDRRYRPMRTHTAMHALCGIIWDRFQSPVTGGNMEPGEGRLDFELPGWDGEFKPESRQRSTLRFRRRCRWRCRSSPGKRPTWIRA